MPNQPMPPCKIDGVNCVNRHQGCRSECPDYLTYEKEFNAYKETIRKGRFNNNVTFTDDARRRHAVSKILAGKRKTYPKNFK